MAEGQSANCSRMLCQVKRRPGGRPRWRAIAYHAGDRGRRVPGGGGVAMTDGPESEHLRRKLVGKLREDGLLADPRVAGAFLAVPRERFVPEAAERDGLEAVYADRPILTRRDARGFPTSSSSQPAIMAAMLDALCLRPGQRVLEVGAGTGYNAALLTGLAGPTGRGLPPAATRPRWWSPTAAPAGRRTLPTTG